jgi:hypothetical protein
MNQIVIDKDFITTVALIVSVFVSLLAFLMFYVRKKSETKLIDRYDSEKKMIELEYMRQNLERQLYEVARKLEENENRWRDINHLIVSSQSKLNNLDYVKNDVQSNEFLRNLGLTNSKDFEIESRQIFVLTPFNKEYNNVFHTIREVCERQKFKCIRGDEEFIPDDIFPVVLKQVVKSRLIIANITGRNPNVMYELGIAHAIGKLTLIIAQNFTDIPFDLNNKRIIIYDNLEDLSLKLKNSLSDMLINKLL